MKLSRALPLAALLSLAAAPNALAGADPFEVGAVSVDGTVIAFDTDRALLPADQNATRDVYVRNPAGLHLLTSGGAADEPRAVT